LQLHAAIPKIMLAMGARSVEAVKDVKHASLALTDYEYLVNKDDSNHVAKLRVDPCQIISWDWVKDALISRCIPPNVN
jgi:hypothetical protein